MRGKVRDIAEMFHSFRITPAYAGKRLKVWTYPLSCQDHPCICGEKIAAAVLNVTVTGSPLHMRGKVGLLAFKKASVRITPAYAGKSRQAVDKIQLDKDHPCICGEKLRNSNQALQRLGSPLHMRGKAITVLAGETSTRITPAYAGKSRIIFIIERR